VAFDVLPLSESLPRVALPISTPSTNQVMAWLTVLFTVAV